MPKLKNPTVKQLKKILWKNYVSPYIRRRDKGVCFTCNKVGSWKEMHAGHFIPKGSYSDTEFDETNINCQCNKCNTYLGGNMAEYTIRMIDKYGREYVDQLRFRGRQTKKWTKEELKDLIEYYKDQIEKLKIVGSY
jgi:hypothetical protein